MADAALRERRAATSGQASSGTTSGGRSAGAILQTTQLLRVQLRAAEQRAERALLHVERWRAELESHVEPKRRRLDGSASVPDHPRVGLGGVNPPNWKHYHNYAQQVPGARGQGAGQTLARTHNSNP